MILKNPTTTRERAGRSAHSSMMGMKAATMILSILSANFAFAAADLVENKFKITKTGTRGGNGGGESPGLLLEQLDGQGGQDFDGGHDGKVDLKDVTTAKDVNLEEVLEAGGLIEDGEWEASEKEGVDTMGEVLVVPGQDDGHELEGGGVRGGLVSVRHDAQSPGSVQLTGSLVNSRCTLRPNCNLAWYKCCETKCSTLENCMDINGTYNTREKFAVDRSARPWWAFKPESCPAEGCPLFIWLDGTTMAEFGDRQQEWMEEMFNRGFVAVTAIYADAEGNYGGCYGSPFNPNVGVVDKCQDIFDRQRSDSLINQLCKIANCDLGVAVAGFSQGSQIVSLAGDYDDRVSAALLYGSGNNPHLTLGHMYCMDTLKLAKQRRRYFSGDNDYIFGLNYDGVRTQLTEMSNYDDCVSSSAPDNCLQHSPSSTSDPYTGGVIDNTGGYYIVKDGSHGNFMNWSTFTKDAEFNKKTHLDWLASTAIVVKPPLQQDDTSVTLEMDLDHRWLLREKAEQGIYFEWAANVNDKRVLGRRWVVAYKTTDYKKTFHQVPSDVVGFRLTARTIDAAFVDQLHVKQGRNIFKNLSFDKKNYDGFCFSIKPDQNFGRRCLGKKSYSCIDFCTDGKWKVCTDKDEFSLCHPLKLPSEKTKAAKVATPIVAPALQK